MYPFLEPHGVLPTVAYWSSGVMAVIGGEVVYPGWCSAGWVPGVCYTGTSNEACTANKALNSVYILRSEISGIQGSEHASDWSQDRPQES